MVIFEVANDRCEMEQKKVDESLFQVEMPVTGQYGHKVRIVHLLLIVRGESRWSLEH